MGFSLTFRNGRSLEKLDVQLSELTIVGTISNCWHRCDYPRTYSDVEQSGTAYAATKKCAPVFFFCRDSVCTIEVSNGCKDRSFHAGVRHPVSRPNAEGYRHPRRENCQRLAVLLMRAMERTDASLEREELTRRRL